MYDFEVVIKMNDEIIDEVFNFSLKTCNHTFA